LNLRIDARRGGGDAGAKAAQAATPNNSNRTLSIASTAALVKGVDVKLTLAYAPPPHYYYYYYYYYYGHYYYYYGSQLSHQTYGPEL